MAKRKKKHKPKKAAAAQPGRRQPSPAAPSAAPRPGIARSAGAAASATMLSRITGLVREQAIAFLFGAGAATDAYNVAFRIPNLLRDMFAEGALNSAFTPTFTEKLEREGRASAFALTNRVVGAVIVIVGALALIGIAFAPQLVALTASGLLEKPEQATRTVLMVRILMPFILAISLAAVAMGALNSLGHYFVPALAPVTLNLGSVVLGGGLALAAPRLGIEPIVGLAIGTLAGGVGQWLCQLPTLAREGYRLQPKVDFVDVGVRKILALMAPATLANGTTQINVLINTQIASWLVEGSISWLSFAFRLMQLPIGIFGVALGQASQPRIKLHLTRGETAEAREALIHALALVFVCTVPATMVLMVLARPIVGLLYEYRHFNAYAADQTAAALAYYAIGLVGFSAAKVLAPAYYALDDSRVPVRASIAAVISNVILSFALMKPLGHCGLALATSLNGLVNMALLLAPMRHRLPGFRIARVLDSLGRVLVASAGMGLVCHFAAGALAGWLGTASPFARLATVSLSMGAGLVALIPLLKLTGVREVDDAIGLVARKLRRA